MNSPPWALPAQTRPADGSAGGFPLAFAGGFPYHTFLVHIESHMKEKDTKESAAPGPNLSNAQVVGIDRNNILDRITPQQRKEYCRKHSIAREQWLLEQCPEFSKARPEPARVLTVGCGAYPGRGLPEGSYRLIGLDSDPERVKLAKESTPEADMHLGTATDLPFEDASVDVVHFRLVLHHIIYQCPLEPVFREAARVLAPGGIVVLVEPNVFHPVNALLLASIKLKLSRAIAGTVDDIPLSPRAMLRLLRDQGLSPRLHGVEYGWRRLPVPVQKALGGFEILGTGSVGGYLSHTFMATGRKHT